MDELLRTVGKSVCEADLAKWRQLLKFVVSTSEADDWARKLEKIPDGYIFLQCLKDLNLILPCNVKLLEKMVACLKQDALMDIVKRYVEGQAAAAAPSSQDALDEIIMQIAYVEKLGLRWTKLALLGLALRTEDIDEIKSKGRHDGDLCFLALEAMQVWRRREGSKASMDRLVQALEKCNERRIAHHIREVSVKG